MSDGEELLVVLWLIYLTGCFTWLDRRTTMVSSWWGFSWHAHFSNPIWGSGSGSFLLQNIVPAPGSFLAAHILPVSLSPTALVAYNLQCLSDAGRPEQSGRAVELAEIRSLQSDSSSLIVNGTEFCDFASPELAHDFTGLLKRLSQTPIDKRDGIISDFWRSRLQLHAVKNSIRKCLSAVRTLQLLCLCAFFLFFVGFPWAAFTWGTENVVLTCALAMFLSIVPICCEYAQLNKRLFSSHRDGVKADLFKMAFCPVTAIRATDFILEKYFADHDPLPVVCLLLKGNERKTILEKFVRDLTYPLYFDGEVSDVVRETCLYQNRKIVEIASECIPLMRRTVASLEDLPKKETPAIVAYCPRCLSQFTILHRTCPHCGEGVTMKTFEKRIGTENLQGVNHCDRH